MPALWGLRCAVVHVPEEALSLKFGKREIQAVAKVLDEDYDTADDAALACLNAMEKIFEDRAKFVVVGQLSSTRDLGTIPPSDPEAIKVCLGFYSTEGDAKTAANSLWHNTASGDTFRTWYLDVFHGSPADFHASRREQYAALEAKRREADAKRIKDWVAKREQENRDAAEAWRKNEAVQEPYPCTQRTIKEGTCLHRPTCK